MKLPSLLILLIASCIIVSCQPAAAPTSVPDAVEPTIAPTAVAIDEAPATSAPSPTTAASTSADRGDLVSTLTTANGSDDTVGCPGADYADWQESPYVLPFPVGETFDVDLSQCSSSYHGEGQPDEFAIDFDMPIGTLVTASRAGTVILIEESGVDGRQPNNLVAVEHEDGTVMAYMHLTNNGAIVEVGDEVEQGDEIGFSGNTGLAGYPHLHLVLLPNDDPYPYRSIPMNFSNTAPNPRSLKSYTTYTAQDY